MLLGAIADDLTGASDLASVLKGAGRRVVQTMGVPAAVPENVDAIVVATKSRTAPVAEARAMAEEALEFLRRTGAEQFYFKYCSTFDSTAQGNIGPLTDLLLDRLGADFTICAPSYPKLKRTVYQGHLFVADQLLSETPMRDHPLTPMRDANLLRVLGRQTAYPVGLIRLQEVEQGVEAVRATIARLRAEGVRMAIADAITDAHIATLGRAAADLKLVTGGAALGGVLGGGGGASPYAADPAKGPTALLSGSCSAATLGQVAKVIDKLPSLRLDPIQLAADPSLAERAIAWAVSEAGRGDFLIYSTTQPDQVQRTQASLGRGEAAQIVERSFAAIAARLAQAGVRRFVVAGGETSGAVGEALGLRMAVLGDELAPGVPWLHSLEPYGFTLALKSGNFGGPDFFEQALAR